MPKWWVAKCKKETFYARHASWTIRDSGKNCYSLLSPLRSLQNLVCNILPQFTLQEPSHVLIYKRVLVIRCIGLCIMVICNYFFFTVPSWRLVNMFWRWLFNSQSLSQFNRRTGSFYLCCVNPFVSSRSFVFYFVARTCIGHCPCCAVCLLWILISFPKCPTLYRSCSFRYQSKCPDYL